MCRALAQDPVQETGMRPIASRLDRGACGLLGWLMPQSASPSPKPPLPIAFLRAVRLKCPACGKGALYRAYLKPVAACACCGEPLGQIPSEDGPAWLTVLMLGPFLVGVTFIVSLSGLPLWMTLPAAALAVTGGVMLALPLVKALFITALWSMGKTSGSQE